MALGPAKLTDLDDPLRGPRAEPPAAPDSSATPTPSTRRRPRAAAPARRQGQPQAEDATPPTDVSPGDPYAGSPKIAVNMRATKQLWDQLGALTRELEGEGLRTSRTELTEALWHFHAPRDATAARELVRRYRRVRVG
jgi:hypothetical protein